MTDIEMLVDHYKCHIKAKKNNKSMKIESDHNRDMPLH